MRWSRSTPRKAAGAQSNAAPPQREKHGSWGLRFSPDRSGAAVPPIADPGAHSTSRARELAPLTTYRPRRDRPPKKRRPSEAARGDPIHLVRAGCNYFLEPRIGLAKAVKQTGMLAFLFARDPVRSVDQATIVPADEFRTGKCFPEEFAGPFSTLLQAVGHGAVRSRHSLGDHREGGVAIDQGLSAIFDQRSSPGFCTSYRPYI